MHSKEALVTKDSQYFLYQQSAVASRVYLYPTITGRFTYEPGYYLRRINFSNYLLMYVERGELALRYAGRDDLARAGQAVLIDCKNPHEYGNRSGSDIDVAWIHFDGKMAGEFYSLITENAGHVITPVNPYPVTHHLKRIYDMFSSSSPVNEAQVSARITAMLSALAGAHHQQPENASAEVIEAALAFINERFREPLTLEMMAQSASLSPCYFTRVFSAETGFTPHQYLIATRINYAKYLLGCSDAPVKEIAFLSGFNSESGFCATFRKREGVTPGEYRASLRIR